MLFLDHGAQHGQNRAVSQHHFQAPATCSRIMPVQHAVAACVGGDVAADLAAAASAEIHAEHHADIDGRFLHGLQG